MAENRESMWKFPSVRGFVEQSRPALWVTGIFLFIVYGIKVFNVSISHDVEAIMAVPDDLYDSWYSMGRFGLILLKKILGTYVFNPYAAAVLMFLAMLGNSALWNYLFYWLGADKGRASRNNWIFPAIFFTSTIMAEQSGFLLQAYEVNVTLLLLGLALIILYKVFLEARPVYYVIFAVIFCVFAFSVYQSFVPLFAAGAAMCFLLVYDRCLEQKPKMLGVKFCWTLVCKLAAVFAVSLLLYQAVNKIVVAAVTPRATSYITDQVLWGKAPVRECLYNIALHVFRVLTGEGFFYTAASLFAFAALAVYAVVRKKGKGYSVYVLAALFCIASPFLMTIFLGEAPTARTQILLPFVVGFCFQYVVKALPQGGGMKKAVCAAAAAVLLIFSMSQSLNSARLYYTQYVTYEEDVRLAVKITDRIDQLGLGETPKEPVVFVGGRTPQRNGVCLSDTDLELIGRSFFQISYSAKHGSWVMNHFLDTLGYSYVFPTDEQVAAAEEKAQDMPVWPDEGSVALAGDVIIVKLSETASD